MSKLEIKLWQVWLDKNKNRFIITKIDEDEDGCLGNIYHSIDNNGVAERFSGVSEDCKLLAICTSFQQAVSSSEFRTGLKTVNLSFKLEHTSNIDDALKDLFTPKEGNIVTYNLKVPVIVGSEQHKILEEYRKKQWGEDKC